MSQLDTVTDSPVKDTLHLMIDFETLGLRPNSVVLSVGICPIPRQHNLFPAIYKEFSVGDQYLRTSDSKTFDWWKGQPNPPFHGTEDLHEGFEEICQQLTEATAIYDVNLWANGTDFDIPLFYNVLDAMGIKSPIPYNNVRDYRTLRKLFWDVKEDARVGQSHHALDDAQHQAAHLQKIFDHIQKLRGTTAMSHIT